MSTTACCATQPLKHSIRCNYRLTREELYNTISSRLCVSCHRNLLVPGCRAKNQATKLQINGLNSDSAPLKGAKIISRRGLHYRNKLCGRIPQVVNVCALGSQTNPKKVAFGFYQGREQPLSLRRVHVRIF
jgi:hypothetical protein